MTNCRSVSPQICPLCLSTLYEGRCVNFDCKDRERSRSITRAATVLLEVAYPAYCRARPIDAASVGPWNDLVEAMDNLRRAL